MMVLTARRKRLFTVLALMPTILLLVIVLFLSVVAFRGACYKKRHIEGHAFPHNEVPLEHFKTYVTLPTGCSFTTYHPNPGEMVTTYTINSYGMRDEEFPRRKPKGEYRIALFGDSFTEGFRVERDRLFAVHLQRILNRGVLPGGVGHVRVMNFGMRGEFPGKYFYRLRDQAMRLRPDLVIVQTFDNDPRDKFRDDAKIRDAHRTLDFLYEKTDFWDMAIGEMIKDMDRLRAFCADKGLPLIVTHVPSLIFFPDEKTYSDDRFESKGISLRRDPAGLMINEIDVRERQWAAETGVRFISMLDRLRERKAARMEPFYFIDDGHFNERGHEVMAEELADAVRAVWNRRSQRNP